MKIKIINFSDIPDKNEYVERFNETFGRNTPTEEYVSWYESEAWNIPTKVVAVFSDADEMLSAAVLFFKRLKICGEIRDVGVMCGAWTLPQFRGCGHMRKMIAATVENFGANGIRYMCGFGLMSNVSSRFERGAGASLMDVCYANGFAAGYIEAEPACERKNFRIDDIFNSFRGSFIYTPRQFAMCYAPSGKTKCYDLPSGDTALIEETPTSFNINFLDAKNDADYVRDLQSLSATVYEFGGGKKPLFVFESSKTRAGLCAKYSFDIKDGYFSILPVFKEYAVETSLNICMGDRQ